MIGKRMTVNRSATDRLVQLVEDELSRQGLNGEQAAREDPPAGRRLSSTATQTSQTDHRPRQRALQSAGDLDDDRDGGASCQQRSRGPERGLTAARRRSNAAGITIAIVNGPAA